MYSPVLAKASAPASKRCHSKEVPVALAAASKDGNRGGGDFGSDAVAGNEGDLVCCGHESSFCVACAALSWLRARCADVFAAEEFFKLRLELADVLEVTIDAGEADVSDGVDVFQAAHDEFTDGACGRFAFGRIDDEGFDLIDDRFELCG